MKKYNLKRFLASLLAVLMLASVTGVSPAVFAEDVGSTPPSQEETVKPVLKDKTDAAVEVIIKVTQMSRTHSQRRFLQTTTSSQKSR